MAYGRAHAPTAYVTRASGQNSPVPQVPTPLAHTPHLIPLPPRLSAPGAVHKCSCSTDPSLACLRVSPLCLFDCVIRSMTLLRRLSCPKLPSSDPARVCENALHDAPAACPSPVPHTSYGRGRVQPHQMPKTARPWVVTDSHLSGRLKISPFPLSVPPLVRGSKLSPHYSIRERGGC